MLTRGKQQSESDAKSIMLAAHETRVLSTDEQSGDNELALQGTSGGISIKHAGAPGHLLAYGFVRQPRRGFSNVIDFSDPQKVKTARLDGAGLRFDSIAGKPLAQVAVVRNVSAEPVTVQGRIPYTLANGHQDIRALPALQLSPGETKEVRLPSISPLVPVAAAGLEFSYAGAPGSVIALALSLSADRNHVFRLPMRDAAIQSSSTGRYPWSIDDKSSTMVYIKNTTAGPKEFTIYVGYDGGSYALGVKTIPAWQTMAFNVRNIRDGQKADVNGGVMPLTATSGHVHWSIRGAEIKPLIGRAEQVNSINGLSMTAACGICCPDSYYDSWVAPSEVLGTVNATTQFTLFRRDRDCYGWVKDAVEHYYSNWSCDNTSVATINAYTGFATAVGIGSSWIRNPFSADIYNDEGSYCSTSTVAADPAALCEVVPSTAPPHRGRIQAQGANPRTEVSRSWAQTNSPTKADGLRWLDEIWNSLNQTQKRDRQRAYEDVRSWIQAAPADGYPQQPSRPFRDPQRRDPTARIDIEIITGRAFTN